MTNTKHTRKALLSSVVALLLCFSMLMGTTFAWFTDSVTSANNIIQSGKLDVTMEYSDSVTTPNWQDASGTAIFDYELWEPGYVEVKYIKIANAGNLAFRYELSVIPETQPAAGEVNLADVIDVYFYEFPAGAPLADITKDQLTDALKVGTLTDMMAENDGAAHGVILPLNGSTNVTLKAEDEAIAREGETVAVIALKMQETAGNEYQGKDVGGTFAVQLLATQYTYEKDSFDNQFDNDSTYPAVDTVTVPENNTEDVVLSTETVKVTVPAASAQEGDDYKIVVSNETVETDSATGETTVGFDLTMYKNDAKVSGDTVYEVEWNVGTGLIISEVTHNGTALTQATTGADQTYTYDAATGVLTIYTKSFSPFEVTYTALKETFADNSWDIIIQACQSNSVPASWSVGDKKAMTIGGSTYD
ncbi:MAG: hypothetical protein J6R04_00615, partial [Clostridia bacterium]|nr:hypothetical protein [Clostridia bacterium]